MSEDIVLDVISRIGLTLVLPDVISLMRTCKNYYEMINLVWWQSYIEYQYDIECSSNNAKKIAYQAYSVVCKADKLNCFFTLTMMQGIINYELFDIAGEMLKAETFLCLKRHFIPHTYISDMFIHAGKAWEKGVVQAIECMEKTPPFLVLKDGNTYAHYRKVIYDYCSSYRTYVTRHGQRTIPFDCLKTWRFDGSKSTRFLIDGFYNKWIADVVKQLKIDQ